MHPVSLLKKCVIQLPSYPSLCDTLFLRYSMESTRNRQSISKCNTPEDIYFKNTHYHKLITDNIRFQSSSREVGTPIQVHINGTSFHNQESNKRAVLSVKNKKKNWLSSG